MERDRASALEVTLMYTHFSEEYLLSIPWYSFFEQMDIAQARAEKAQKQS